MNEQVFGWWVKLVEIFGVLQEGLFDSFSNSSQVIYYISQNKLGIMRSAQPRVVCPESATQLTPVSNTALRGRRSAPAFLGQFQTVVSRPSGVPGLCKCYFPADRFPRHFDNAEGAANCLSIAVCFSFIFARGRNDFAMLRARPQPADFIGGLLLGKKNRNIPPDHHQKCPRNV